MTKLASLLPILLLTGCTSVKYPINPLDGKQNKPFSIHCARGYFMGGSLFMKQMPKTKNGLDSPPEMLDMHITYPREAYGHSSDGEYCNEAMANDTLVFYSWKENRKDTAIGYRCVDVKALSDNEGHPLTHYVSDAYTTACGPPNDMHPMEAPTN